MKSKHCKLLIALLSSLFISIPFVSARELTLDELTSTVEQYRSESENSDAIDGYIFIIGKHVYTSNYTLSIEDIAVGATTGGMDTADKVWMYRVDRVFDGWNPSGWDTENIATEMGKINPSTFEKFDIDFIDTLPIAEIGDNKVLVAAQDSASTYFNNFVENSDLKRTVPGTDVDYQSTVAESIAKTYSDIYSADTVEAVTEAVEAGKTAVLNALKENVKAYLDTVYNNGSAYWGLILSEENYNKYVAANTAANNFAEVINSYEEALTKRYTVASLEEVQSNAISEWDNYVENSDLKRTVPGSDADYASTIQSTIGAGYGHIWAASNIEGVSVALQENKDNVLVALKDVLKSFLTTVYNNGNPYFGLILSEANYNAVASEIANATDLKTAIDAYEKVVADDSTYREKEADLIAAKETATSTFNAFINESLLTEEVPGSDVSYVEVFASDIDAVTTAINNAKTKDEVTSAESLGEETIIALVKDKISYYLETVYNEGKPFFGMVLSSDDYNDALTRVEDATTIDAIITAYNETLEGRFNLEEHQTTEASNFTSFVENGALKEVVPGGDGQDYASVLSGEIAQVYSAIYSAQNEEELTNAVASGKSAILSALKETISYYLETVYNNGEAYYGLILSAEKYNTALETVNGAETIEAVISAYNDALTDRFNLVEAQNTAIANFRLYANEKLGGDVVGFADTTYVSALSAEIDAICEGFKNTTSEEELQTAVEEGKVTIVSDLKVKVNEYLTTAYNEGKPYDEMVLSEEKYTEAQTNVTNANTIEDVILAYEDAMNNGRITLAQYNLNNAIDRAIEDFNAYFADKASLYTINKDTLETEIATSIETIKGAVDTTDVLNKYNTEIARIEATVKTDADELAEEISAVTEAFETFIAPLDEEVKILTNNKFEMGKLNAQSTIATVIEEVNASFNGQFSTREAVQQALTDGETKVINATKEYVQNSLTELKKFVYGSELYLEQSNYDEAMRVLSQEDVTLTAIIDAYKTACSKTLRMVTVTSQDELEDALAAPDITNILLGNNIEVDTSIVVNRSVTIDGQGNTIAKTGTPVWISGGDNYIFKIYGGSEIDVVVKSINLTNAMAAIIVGDNANVTVDGVNVDGNVWGGIEVKGKLNVVSITQDSEVYGKPTVWVDTDMLDTAVVNYPESTKVEIIKDGKVQYHYYGVAEHAHTVAVTNESELMAALSDSNITTVTLSENIEITAGSEKTIDLNGKTLTSSATTNGAIINNGKLTLTGNGTVVAENTNVIYNTLGAELIIENGTYDALAHGKAVIYNEGGTTTINGGTFTRTNEAGVNQNDNGGNSYYTLLNHGVMTINDGTFENNGKYSSLLENGYFSYPNPVGTNVANPSLTINGGTFKGGLHTIKNDDGAILEINDGMFIGTTKSILMNYNVATINGGTFDGSNDVYTVFYNTIINDTVDKGELTINGGTIIAGTSGTLIRKNSYSLGPVTINDEKVVIKNADGVVGTYRENNLHVYVYEPIAVEETPVEETTAEETPTEPTV